LTLHKPTNETGGLFIFFLIQQFASASLIGQRPSFTISDYSASADCENCSFGHSLDTKNRTLDSELVEDPTQILSPIQVLAIYHLILKIYHTMDANLYDIFVEYVYDVLRLTLLWLGGFGSLIFTINSNGTAISLFTE
jgi:hypothetical protein